MAKKPSPERSEFDYVRLADRIDQARTDMMIERVIDPVHRAAALDELDDLPQEQRREVQAHVAERAEHSYEDIRTDLPNERWFKERLATAESLNRRYDLPVHVLIMDMGGLKYFNDRYGYSAGNEALATVASAMEAVSRQDESFAHRSGDEFGAVIFNGNPQPLIDRLKAELARPEYSVNGKQLELYFGLAALQPGESIKQTLVKAEQLQKDDKHTRRAEVMTRLEA